MFLNQNEIEYIQKIPHHELIAWTDTDAVEKYPKLKWVYDKYELNCKLNLTPTINLWYNMPDKYPVFIKPRINLLGMGRQAQIVYSSEEIIENGYRATHIAQPIFKGEYITTDFLIQNKQVVDYFSFSATFDNYGSFSYFFSIPYFNELAFNVAKRVGLDNGVINIETIGNNVLEVHLRPSIQFCNICGGLINQLSYIIQGMTPELVDFEQTYSVTFRTIKDQTLKLPKRLPKLPKTIRSITFDYNNGDKLSECMVYDTHTYRYMVINGTNLDDIHEYGEKIKKRIGISD